MMEGQSYADEEDDTPGGMNWGQMIRGHPDNRF
jgi:hypothetical protein